MADIVVAALLIIPIALLVRAFRTTDYNNFANLDRLLKRSAGIRKRTSVQLCWSRRISREQRLNDRPQSARSQSRYGGAP